MLLQTLLSSKVVHKVVILRDPAAIGRNTHDKS